MTVRFSVSSCGSCENKALIIDDTNVIISKISETEFTITNMSNRYYQRKYLKLVCMNYSTGLLKTEVLFFPPPEMEVYSNNRKLNANDSIDYNFDKDLFLSTRTKYPFTEIVYMDSLVIEQIDTVVNTLKEKPFSIKAIMTDNSIKSDEFKIKGVYFRVGENDEVRFMSLNILVRRESTK